MALKSDDILLVQRGTKSYQMPASQLVTSSEVAPNLQTVTDKGSTTTNKIDITDGNDTIIDGETYKLNASFSGSGTALAFANILRGDSTRTSAFGNNNTGGDLLFFNNVSGNKTSFMRLANNGQLQLGSNLTANTANIFFNNNGSGIFGGQLEANDRIDCYRPSANGNTYIQRWHSDVNGTKTQVAAFLSDGRSEFVNSVSVGTSANPIDAGTWGFQTYGTNNENGYALYLASTHSTPSAPYVTRCNVGGVGDTVVIKSDGSADFADRVTTGDSTGRGQFLGTCPSSITASSADAFVAQYDGGDVFNVKYDGSADFKGRVTVQRDTDTSAGLSIQKSDGTNVHLLYGNGNATFAENKITFAGADGSATFASNVAVGGSVGNQTVTGVYLNADGYVASTADGTNNIWNGYQKDTAGQTSAITADGQAIFNARVSGTMTAIDSTGAWDAKDSNFWTVAGPTLSNPSSRTAGQTGVFYCTGEVNSFGNHYSFPGGVTPTIPANSVVPYFVDAAEKIRLGIATEAFV